MPSPRDADEDDSLPLRSEISAMARPVAAANHAPQSLAWGVCGVLHQASDLNEFPGERGVIRYVTSGVRFVQPPTNWEWRAMLAEPGRFEMKWPGDPAQARTLSALRKDLDAAARGQQLDSPQHPLLKELDSAALALCRLAEKLHGAGWSLGLVRPDNVVLFNREAIAIDLGFAWSGTFGSPPWDDSPGRPAWLDPDGLFTWLYDHPPVRQQFANPGNAVYPPASEVEDVKTLARLFAWLVAGFENHSLPEVRNAPPSWAVLTAAASGQLSSASELAQELRRAPLSGYFIRPLEPEATPPASSKSSLVMLVAFGLIVCAAGLGGVWYYLKEKPNDTARVSTTEKETPPSPPVPIAPDKDYRETVEELDKTSSRQIGRLYELLRKAYALATPEQKQALAARRVKALNDWIAAYKEVDGLAALPGQRLEAAQKYRALKSDLEALTRSHPASDPAQIAKEKQCLEFVSTRVRELAGSASASSH